MTHIDSDIPFGSPLLQSAAIEQKEIASLVPAASTVDDQLQSSVATETGAVLEITTLARKNEEFANFKFPAAGERIPAPAVVLETTTLGRVNDEFRDFKFPSATANSDHPCATQAVQDSAAKQSISTAVPNPEFADFKFPTVMDGVLRSAKAVLESNCDDGPAAQETRGDGQVLVPKGAFAFLENDVGTAKKTESSGMRPTTTGHTVVPPPRNLMVLITSTDTPTVIDELPDTFYEVTATDLVMLAASRKAETEEKPLLTEALREYQDPCS